MEIRYENTLIQIGTSLITRETAATQKPVYSKSLQEAGSWIIQSQVQVTNT